MAREALAQKSVNSLNTHLSSGEETDVLSRSVSRRRSWPPLNEALSVNGLTNWSSFVGWLNEGSLRRPSVGQSTLAITGDKFPSLSKDAGRPQATLLNRKTLMWFSVLAFCFCHSGPTSRQWTRVSGRRGRDAPWHGNGGSGELWCHRHLPLNSGKIWDAEDFVVPCRIWCESMSQNLPPVHRSLTDNSPRHRRSDAKSDRSSLG